LDVIKQITQSGATTVFLRGETGTGKDLLAGVLHYNSDRAPHPFMNITCTAISETLLESELFGHERGAFTDAKSQKKGLLEQADGGTVFLDEVGDMASGLQAKLLRFLEDRTFRRVGGTEEISVDVRVIAATNRNIEKAVEEGAFRRDLLFRLNVVPVFIPPLRERGDDLRLLMEHFVAHFSREFKKPINRIDSAVHSKLMAYSWPGNVRELRNVCERAVLLCPTDVLRAEDIVLGPSDQHSPNADLDLLELPPEGLDFFELEGQLLRQALARAGNNQTKAAKLLNISRDTFRYRLEKHGPL
jgi:transcriptional regulator with PAS, ATPase and Fis domain